MNNKWEDALAFVESNDNFGYDKAVSYYRNLKERMFAQISLSKNLKIAVEQEKLNLISEGENSLESGLSQNLYMISDDTLRKIQNWLIRRMDDESISSIVSEINQEISTADQRVKKSGEYNAKVVDAQVNKLYETFKSSSQVARYANKALAEGYTPEKQDLSSVTNFLEGFIKTQIKYVAVAGKKAFITSNNTTTLMGYYKELIELKLFKDYFESLGASVELIGGKNTISDLLISFQNFASGASVSQDLCFVPDKYGVQIKSRNIEKVETDFFKISHSQGLADRFNSISATGFNTYSWCCGVVFLGQMNHILQSLGTNNVIFVSGPNRYFMDSFIEYFRGQQMYLSFAFKEEDHKATSQIGLQRFMGKKGKILSRFANQLN